MEERATTLSMKRFQGASKMKPTFREILSTTMFSALLALGIPAGRAQAPSATAQPSSAPTVAPQTSSQLDALVAPIALYPDALVAQVLGAATFPDQLAIADYWLGQNKSLTGDALAKAVDQQSWDPSVKALTQFPDVLDDLAKNLAWTSSLGEAFHNQQADVMAAVQAMRAKAQAAGNLKSTAQVKVVQQTPQTIVIQPANPQVVYVPQYNPALVYGVPYVVPLYRPRVVIAAAPISFGVGIAIGGGFGGGFVGGFGGGFGWGFHSWNCNWGGGGGGGTVIYNHNTYISNNSWHGGHTTYNNYHPWNGGSRGPGGGHTYSPDGGRRGFNGDSGRQFGRPGGERSNSFAGDRDRSRGGRDGWASRAEQNRGRSSMRSGGMRTRSAQMRAPRSGGGRRR
jgi:hypothetical protein